MATPATVVIKERVGASPGTETTITNTNMGSVDTTNMTVDKDTAITAGTYSYEKWQRFYVSAMGDATDIGGLTVWASDPLSGSDIHKTNASHASWVNSSYPAGGPVNTSSSYATNVMPNTTAPSDPNVGIGGDVDDTITSIGYSDYLVMQIYVDSGTTVGASTNMNYRYDEYG